MKIHSLSFVLFLLFANPCQAKLYKYSELEIKNYDEMMSIVQEHITKARNIDMQKQKEAQASGDPDYNEFDSLEELKNALRAIFSRPNKDNLVEKLVPEVRRELNNYGSFYDTINDIVVEAVTGINQKIPVVYRSTYIFVLENVMSEIKPEAKKNEEAKKIIVYIKNADLKLPNDVRLDRKLRSMISSQSPSQTASQVLDQIDGKEKKKKGFWDWLF